MDGFDGFGGFVPPELSPGQLLSTAGSEIARYSPILGYLWQAALASGEQYPEPTNDPFTGSSYGDSFTTEAYGSPDPFTTANGSIEAVISVGDVPTAGETSSDVQAAFAGPASEDDFRLASNDIDFQPIDPNTPRVPTSGSFQLVGGEIVFVPGTFNYSFPGPSSSSGFSYSPVSDAPDANLGQPLPSPPVSQPSTATGQPTPPVTSSTVSPIASDYNPAADRGDGPNVYAPPPPPPYETWLTAGPSAPPITSSPSTLTPPPNAATPRPPDIPQTTEAPRDFWSTWLGDATQTQWAISAPDRRLIQPITHHDTGNRPLNYVLNKVVFPWENVATTIWNVPFGDLLGLSDLFEQAKRDPDYGLTVQAVGDMLPLEKAMGLGMEIGPALDWAEAWASTNLRTLATGSYSPTWWLMGTGGVRGGGRLGSLPSTASVWRTQEVEDLVQGLEEAGFRVSVQGPEGWTNRQIEAAIEYRTAYSQSWAKGGDYSQAASKGGQAVHSLFGAGEPGMG